MDNQNTLLCLELVFYAVVLILVLMDNQNTLSLKMGILYVLCLNPCSNV